MGLILIFLKLVLYFFYLGHNVTFFLSHQIMLVLVTQLLSALVFQLKKIVFGCNDIIILSPQIFT